MSLVAYQSSQNANSATSPLVITKPVSLAVNDLMVAAISVTSTSGDSANINAPAGWTAIQPRVNVLGATGNMASFYKLADAADVAATNFSFTASNVLIMSGGISRFTNADALLPINASNSGTGTATAASSSGITPTVESMLVIMLIGSNNSALRTSSAYAVATTNPTWTEAYDTGGGGGGGFSHVALAYGPRSAITATGNATATISASENYQLVVFAIGPAPVRPTIFGSTFSVFGVTIPFIMAAPIAMVSTVLSVVVNIIAKKWTNVVKHSASWENEPKSQ